MISTTFSLLCFVAQVAEWLGSLGSRGGPENVSTLFGLALLLTPSPLLGSSFLVFDVSIHQLAPHYWRVWSHSAVAFATAQAVLISTLYLVQLACVAPGLARGEVEGIEIFVFVPFDSFLYAVDILDDSFMSVSTLFRRAETTGAA